MATTRDAPPSAGTMTAFVVGLSVILIVYSSTIQLIPRFNVLYVPLNLAATGGLAVLAWRFGLTALDIGLERETWRSGVTWGGWVAAAAAAALTIGVAVPAFHPVFDDARISDIGLGLLAYRALIRIPLGTALFEEFAFRGALFGAWAKVSSPLQAAVGSSLVFGIWHIRPTIDLLDANDLAMSVAARGTALTIAVLSTAIAGYLFCVLRMRSRSLIAPYVAHAAINSFAIVAAFVINGGN